MTDQTRATLASIWLLFFLHLPVLAQQVSNPREMLDIMQIDASQRRHFLDDRSVEEEVETLGRLLFRLPSFSEVDIDRWAKPIEDVAAMLRNPDSYRFEIFQIRGEVERVQSFDLLPESVPRLGFRRYFEVTIRHNEETSLVYTRTIPKRWMSDAPAAELRSENVIGQAVRFQGLLLKRGVDEAGKKLLVFAAPRINWHPSRPSEPLGVDADQVLIGQLGLDLDRLSELVQRSKMTGRDRECFYQALSAVRHTEPEQLLNLGRTEFEIARFIKTPEAATGELYTLSGTARRAIQIRVPDADIQERFGIDHYYEIEVFIPLERQVRFVDPQEPDDQEGKVFQDYPFVICVPTLPSGMEQGDDIRVPVTFSGFFLKLWAYESAFMTGGRARTAKPRLQQSPLFVGPTVLLGEQLSPQKSQLSLYIACLFVGLLSVIWFLLWRSSIQDRKASKRLFEKHEPSSGAFEMLGE